MTPEKKSQKGKACMPPEVPDIEWGNSTGIAPPSQTAKSYMHSEGMVDSNNTANIDPFMTGRE